MEVEKITEHEDGSATVDFEMDEDEVKLFKQAVKKKTPFIVDDKKYLIKEDKNGGYALKEFPVKKKKVKSATITKKKKRS